MADGLLKKEEKKGTKGKSIMPPSTISQEVKSRFSTHKKGKKLVQAPSYVPKLIVLGEQSTLCYVTWTRVKVCQVRLRVKVSDLSNLHLKDKTEMLKYQKFPKLLDLFSRSIS